MIFGAVVQACTRIEMVFQIRMHANLSIGYFPSDLRLLARRTARVPTSIESPPTAMPGSTSGAGLLLGGGGGGGEAGL